MPYVTRTRNGQTQILAVPASQMLWWAGQGYVRTDLPGIPLRSTDGHVVRDLTVVGGQLIVTYTDGTTFNLGPISGDDTPLPPVVLPPVGLGLTLDTDGVPFPSFGAAGRIVVDTDGVPYYTTSPGYGLTVDTDAVPYLAA